MDGVRVISSLAVLVFLLLASFSAAREERSPRSSGWQDVQNLADSKYLAVLKVKNVATCAGSIPSEWTVLTLCKAKTDPSETKAYAGMLGVDDEASGQERDVNKVVAHGTLKDLKILTLTENWDLKNKVGSIAVSGTPGESCKSLGFGGTSKVARAMVFTFAAASACKLVNSPDMSGFVVESGKDQTHGLAALDLGGPVVCGSVQRAINQEYKTGISRTTDCNLYIEIANHRTWIEGEIEKAQVAAAGGTDGTDGTGGTGGNGTASSGYSIHSHLNKYSNWKVLWFLVPTIVTFLQY